VSRPPGDLICGINPVLEALSAGERAFDRLLIAKGVRNRRIADAITRAGALGIPLRFEDRQTLDRMAAGVLHQGVIAVVSAKAALGLEELLGSAGEPALLVVLDGVEDPRNLGAILRTVEAAGADGVVIPERHSAGLSETVARASAGALEHVRVARVTNVAQAIGELKERGIWVIGFDAGGTERWDAVDYRRPVALVLGGEGRGMRRLVRERCDHVAAVPLLGRVGSLNVSVTAGIALYEVVRQRGTVAPRPVAYNEDTSRSWSRRRRPRR
jgi:23S rRNA (guanosine2251-2'-O)-methyltransferase